MAHIGEIKADLPKRASVRDLLYSTIKQSPMNIKLGQIESLMNEIIDIAVRESIEQFEQRIPCACQRIEEDTIKVNPNCPIHGKARR